MQEFCKKILFEGGQIELSDVLMNVLEQCKVERGRQALIKALRPTKYPQEIPLTSKDTLVDVVRAALRHANNQKDFSTCKQLLDLSLHYYFCELNSSGNKFLYSFIRDHEVYKNQLFWDLCFLGVYFSHMLLELRLLSR